MLAFSGAVVALYSEVVLRRVDGILGASSGTLASALGGVVVLRGLLAGAAALPALFVASQLLDARTNHWEDVVVGLLLGTLFAAYVVSGVLDRIGYNDKGKSNNKDNK